MREKIEITINGDRHSVAPGTSIASAIMNCGQFHLRHSITGEPRGPMCGMGVCFECCVTVNGIPHVRSCVAVCEPGMDIRTT